MTFKTLCEHIIQDGNRKNEMCGCYVYRDECVYCEDHESLYGSSNSCFEIVIEYVQKVFRKWDNLEIDSISKLV